MIAPMVTIGMWILSPAARKLPASVLRVGVALANYYNREKDAAWPSERRLADDLNMDRSNVRRALKILTGPGGPFVVVTEGRGTRSKVYRFSGGNVIPSSGGNPASQWGQSHPASGGNPVRSIDSRNLPIEPAQGTRGPVRATVVVNR